MCQFAASAQYDQLDMTVQVVLYHVWRSLCCLKCEQTFSKTWAWALTWTWKRLIHNWPTLQVLATTIKVKLELALSMLGTDKVFVNSWSDTHSCITHQDALFHGIKFVWHWMFWKHWNLSLDSFLWDLHCISMFLLFIQSGELTRNIEIPSFLKCCVQKAEGPNVLFWIHTTWLFISYYLWSLCMENMISWSSHQRGQHITVFPSASELKLWQQTMDWKPRFSLQVHQ